MDLVLKGISRSLEEQAGKPRMLRPMGSSDWTTEDNHVDRTSTENWMRDIHVTMWQ